jgi:hypothetical protein
MQPEVPRRSIQQQKYYTKLQALRVIDKKWWYGRCPRLLGPLLRTRLYDCALESTLGLFSSAYPHPAGHPKTRPAHSYRLTWLDGTTSFVGPILSTDHFWLPTVTATCSHTSPALPSLVDLHSGVSGQLGKDGPKALITGSTSDAVVAIPVASSYPIIRRDGSPCHISFDFPDLTIARGERGATACVSKTLPW